MKKNSNITTLKLALAIIVMLVLVFLGIQVLGIFAFTGSDSDNVRNLKMEQDGFKLNISWDESKYDNYNVMLFSGIGRPYHFQTSDNECTIGNIKIGEQYRVIVSAIDDNGNMVGTVQKKLKAKKLVQEIGTKYDELEGFAKDKVKLGVKCHGDVTYKSNNEKVVTVNEKGRVRMIGEGKAFITIKTSGTDNYRAAKKVVDVFVYPGQLDAAKLTIMDKTNTTWTLSWTDVKYADGYKLMKYDVAKQRFEEYKNFDKDKTSVELVRNQAKYQIRATADVNGKAVKGKASNIVEIDSTVKTAKSYSSNHILATLDHSNLETVANISGTGSMSVPQSMCWNGSELIVSYVTTSGSAGAFLSYSKKGNYKRGERASGMGYANGCTYNPNTGKIYVVKTHKGYKTNSCSTYNESDFSSKGSFNLPKVTSGIAYDASNNKYYLSKGNEIYVTDEDFNVKKFIWKKIRYNHAQDIGAYNGAVLVCTWVSGNTSYIDVYRTCDGAYLGSYSVPIGEIESVVSIDGYLYILMNTKGSRNDHIYKTKNRIYFD
ncbi:MAG: hypothetical protein PUB09_06730 [Firmicutes bacterium]|nr:hypothetical protein [Bacillota bacterium]